MFRGLGEKVGVGEKLCVRRACRLGLRKGARGANEV
jgi:hypothetical protein